MSQAAINSYLDNITQQISVSVERLKYKSSSLGKNKPEAVEAEAEQGSGYNQQSLRNYSYQLLATASSYDLNAYNSEQQDVPNREHAISSYNQVKTVDDKSKVVLDFMHRYNQNFDFRV